MQKVLDRYVKAIAKQCARRNRQDRDNFTPNENKAILYYGKAAQQLRDLTAAPTPVWVGVKFEKKLY